MKKQIETSNKKSLVIDFDTSYEEDSIVWDFLTKDAATAFAKTNFTISEFIIEMILSEMKNKIKNKQIIKKEA